MTDESKQHAKVTAEMLAKVRARIGVEFKLEEPYFNTQATRDTIRHFCDGIGDDNPLFCDPIYAPRSPYGRLVAPPAFLYSVYWPAGRGGSMAGIHGWHSGNDWEWYLPLLDGDQYSVVIKLLSVEEKKGRMANTFYITTDEVTYRNQRGKLVAKAKGWAVRAERGAAGQAGKYRHVEKAKYTAEQMKKILDDYSQEITRGSSPRFWEDVGVGDDLPPVVKGPLSVRDMNCWLMGGGSPYMKSHGLFVKYWRKHPAVGMVDSATGEVDVPELVHMQDSRASEIGVPGAYDYGCQRMSWMGHLLTNWAGDHGFITRLHGELRLFNVVGDTTWIRGKVTKKHVDGEESLVDIDCWGENQRGEVTMPGNATVALPSKDKGTWPVQRRLEELER